MRTSPSCAHRGLVRASLALLSRSMGWCSGGVSGICGGSWLRQIIVEVAAAKAWPAEFVRSHKARRGPADDRGFASPCCRLGHRASRVLRVSTGRSRDRRKDTGRPQLCGTDDHDNVIYRGGAVIEEASGCKVK